MIVKYYKYLFGVCGVFQVQIVAYKNGMVKYNFYNNKRQLIKSFVSFAEVLL